jgi:hypothetical protein
MKNLIIFLSIVSTIGFTTVLLAQDSFNVLASVEHNQYREVAPAAAQKNAAYERDLAVWLGTEPPALINAPDEHDPVVLNSVTVAQRNAVYERDLAIWLGIE